MKKHIFLLMTTLLFISACGGGNQPASTPTIEPASNSQTESNPEPTELVEVKVEPQAGDTRAYVDGTTIVYIPAGEFIMGVKDGVDNPEHTVYTDGFWVYSTEVTRSQYEICVATGACSPAVAVDTPFPDDSLLASHPIANVTYEQAQTYCQWANGRLPTEAEWEKAARAPQWTTYPWGNETPSCDRATYGDCESISTEPVAFHPNGQTPYQIFDMAGNIFEWVADWYADDYYLNSPLENPTGPSQGELRGIRGGSYLSNTDALLTFTRAQNDPNASREDLGFRCVVEHENINFFAPMCIQANTIVGNIDPAQIYCPEIKSSSSSFCEGGIPYAKFDFETEPGFSFYSPGLKKGSLTSQQANKVLQSCKSINDGLIETQIAFCPGPELQYMYIGFRTDCKIIGDIENKCSEGYVYDANSNTCKFIEDNNPNNAQCPQGFSFNSDTKCCTAVTGADYKPLCSTGFVYNPYIKACVDAKQQLISDVVWQIMEFPACAIQDKPKEENPNPTEPPVCVPGPTGGCP